MDHNHHVNSLRFLIIKEVHNRAQSSNQFSEKLANLLGELRIWRSLVEARLKLFQERSGSLEARYPFLDQNLNGSVKLAAWYHGCFDIGTYFLCVPRMRHALAESHHFFEVLVPFQDNVQNKMQVF